MHHPISSIPSHPQKKLRGGRANCHTTTNDILSCLPGHRPKLDELVGHGEVQRRGLAHVPASGADEVPQELLRHPRACADGPGHRRNQDYRLAAWVWRQRSPGRRWLRRVGP